MVGFTITCLRPPRAILTTAPSNTQGLTGGPNAVDDTDRKYGGRFNRYGVRVPFVVVSPWVRKGHVSHRTYDHTSIIRFIAARFSLPALTRRDANADPLLDFFDFRDKEAKLAGSVSGWGTETLPLRFPTRVRDHADPRKYELSFVTAADVAEYGESSNGDRYNMKAPRSCLEAFPPATGHTTALGQDVYGATEWSKGIAPPKSYFDSSCTRLPANADAARKQECARALAKGPGERNIRR